MSGVSREYKIEKLLQWNPHWSPFTVKEWKPEQLHEIYIENQQKVVRQIRESLGLDPNK